MRLIGIVLLMMVMTVSSVKAQSSDKEIFDKIKGYWQGAFIKNNAQQPIQIHFYSREGKHYSLQTIEEWHPQFGEFELAVAVDSMGNIITNTGHGKAVLRLDENYLELTGTIKDSNPTMYLHLKKVPAPAAPHYSLEEVNIPNGDISLYGHLHRPLGAKNKTAIILVGGRGCYAGSTKYDLYAKVLRRYGVTVLVFNKRGTGKSTGDCNLATIEDLASDVRACKQYLDDLGEFQNIGVLGSSAGGWVMLKAQEKTSFDFLISVVGPSTSLRDQQFQSMDYGVEFYQLSSIAREQIREYTTLMFDAKANEKNFSRFQQLLTAAEESNWRQLLDDTDIPPNAEAIDDLWVRRHGFNPGKVLSAFDKPYLAIYGEIDWIVPYKENIQLLNNYFSGERARLLKTVIAYKAEHGTETKGAYVTLPNDQSYWHFFRISPQVLIEIVDFLKANKFVE